MIDSLASRLMLNNQTAIPAFGLGVFKVDTTMAAQNVEDAISAGYRLIDTAAIYGNEVETGIGIRNGLEKNGLKREDIFVTTKLWNKHISKEESLKAFDESLKKLNLDYIDLYLLHWPGQNEAYVEPWKALEEIYASGRAKSIGVSNFQIHHLEHLFTFAKVKPVLNQIEFHPYNTRKNLVEFCKKQDIVVQAWSPLMRGLVLGDETINKIAAKYNKTAAQVVLRWIIEKGLCLAVRSTKKERVISNADIFDFKLSAEDIALIDSLNKDERVGPDPDTYDF